MSIDIVFKTLILLDNGLVILRMVQLLKFPVELFIKLTLRLFTLHALRVEPTTLTTYTTKWKYDSQNRILEMEYPDEEKISYLYNRGGLLRQVSGEKSHKYRYIDSIAYDAYEQKVYQKYGNGTETRYSYSNNRALENRYDSLDWECNVRLVDDYVNNKSFYCDGGDFQLAESLGAQSATDTAPALYFYHPDHLGSTAMVTDLDGHITQNVVYIPYGEVFVEERNGNWASPYLFNAKELDEETGLYYYGARYLNPSIALWLSTDPLQGKYPGMSPYNYCAGNPVKLLDPEGRVGL